MTRSSGSSQPELPFSSSVTREPTSDVDGVARHVTWSLSESNGEALVEIRDGAEVIARLSPVAFKILDLKAGSDPAPDLDEQLKWFLTFDKAYAIAVKTLNTRPLSARRLVTKLESRGFTDDVIALVVDSVTESGHLDELSYGRSVVHALMRGSRVVGPHLVRQRLTIRGLQTDVIEQLVYEWEKENEPTTDAAIDALIESSLRRMQRLAPEAQARRIHGLLIRRGFEPADVEAALRARFDLFD